MSRELGTGAGISEAVKRRYGISDDRPVQTIAPDVFTTMPVNDRDLEPDLALLAGVRRFSGGYEITASGGIQGGIALQNPADSGMIVTIDQMWIGGTSPYWIGYVAREDLPSGATGTKRATALDARLAVYAGGSCSSSNKSGSFLSYWATGLASQASRLCEFIKFGGPAAESGGVLEKNFQIWSYPIVLPPQGFVLFQDSGADGEMFVYFQFRERPMAAWEAVTS